MLSKEQLDKIKGFAESNVAIQPFIVLELLQHIDKLQSDYTAQSLALKAAKAMQQAETERADANEQDKRRIDYLSEYGGEWDAWTLWTHGNGFEGDGTLRGAIDEAILHS